MEWQLHTRTDLFMRRTELWLSGRDERTGTPYCVWIEQGNMILREIGTEHEGIRIDETNGFHPFMVFSTHEVITRTAEGVLGAIARFHAEQQPGYRPSTSIEVDLLREECERLRKEIDRRNIIAERQLGIVIAKAVGRESA